MTVPSYRSRGGAKSEQGGLHRAIPGDPTTLHRDIDRLVLVNATGLVPCAIGFPLARSQWGSRG